MLWQRDVYRRGSDVESLWDLLFERRPSRLLYIAGRGFDIRAQSVMSRLVENLELSRANVERADLLLVGFTGYQVSDELHEQTSQNAIALEESFARLGPCQTVSVGSSAGGEDDITASNTLRLGTAQVLSHVSDQTDVILDVSSMPRVAYLALLTGLLHKLVPNKKAEGCLGANGVNFQVLVAEDPILDGQIRSEDPSNDPS